MPKCISSLCTDYEHSLLFNKVHCLTCTTNFHKRKNCSKSIHSGAGLYRGCRQTGQVRIPFCIIAIAHSRWTLCEQGKIWHPLNASSRQIQHSSWPESGLHLCFPCRRLSRHTLHTSQWKDLSLCILHIPHLSQW